MPALSIRLHIKRSLVESFGPWRSLPSKHNALNFARCTPHRKRAVSKCKGWDSLICALGFDGLWQSWGCDCILILMQACATKRPYVLIVDDEPDVLLALKLRLQAAYVVVTARDAEEALERARTEHFHVVLADMNMPGMGGTRLLELMRTEMPDCSRILITASGDLRQAVDAVNRGDLFRFVSKPYDANELRETVEEGVEASKRRTTERELLSGTLEPALQVLVDLLSIQRPADFGRAAAIADKARALAKELKLDNAWEVGMAASLHCIGSLCLPEGVDPPEQEIARLGYELLNPIPRLDGVARILLHQHREFDTSQDELGQPLEEAAPIGARILRVASAINQMSNEGMGASDIFRTLSAGKKQYDPRVVEAAQRCLRPLIARSGTLAQTRRIITLSQLLPGHVLLEDLRTTDGTLLMASGRLVSQTLLETIRQYSHLKKIHEPLIIATPDEELARAESTGE